MKELGRLARRFLSARLLFSRRLRCCLDLLVLRYRKTGGDGESTCTVDEALKLVNWPEGLLVECWHPGREYECLQESPCYAVDDFEWIR